MDSRFTFLCQALSFASSTEGASGFRTLIAYRQQTPPTLTIYLIVVYDVGVDRVDRVCQFLKGYLHRVQNSVFEGELTEAKLARMKTGLAQRLEPGEDSVLIWVFHSPHVVDRQTLGRERFPVTNIL